MSANNGGPAFPQAHTYESLDHLKPGEIGYPVKVTAVASGMTMRDYFAAKALAAMDLRDDGKYSPDDRKRKVDRAHADWAAMAAYRYADAMLRARGEA